MEAPGLVHKDSFVSMTGRGHTQTSSLFGERNSLPVDSMTSLVLFGVSPEEVTTHLIYAVANFFWEEHDLHGIKRDKGNRSFDEGGSASHRKILSLPSFNSLTDIIHQILIGASYLTGGENGRSKIGSYAVCGRKAKDTCHLIFYPPWGSGREPSFRFASAHKLARHRTEVQQDSAKILTIPGCGSRKQEDVISKEKVQETDPSSKVYWVDMFIANHLIKLN